VERLGELWDDAVVVTPGYFRDGGGRELLPLEALQAMARAAAVPVYGPFDPFLGAGIVGGSIVSFALIDQEAGKAARGLLAGTPPEMLRLPPVTPTTLHLDWRQSGASTPTRFRLTPSSISSRHHSLVLSTPSLPLFQALRPGRHFPRLSLPAP
jgi:hypothetical protein